MWDHLLNAILTLQTQFLAAFVKIVLRAVGGPSKGQTDDDTEKEALCMWLVHTTSKKKSWPAVSTSELDALRGKMVRWSCTHPGYWSHYLGVHLIKTGGPEFADIWEVVLEASRVDDGYVGITQMSIAEPEGASSSEAEPDAELVKSSRRRAGHMDDGVEYSRWKRAAATPTLPIGVVR